MPSPLHKYEHYLKKYPGIQEINGLMPIFFFQRSSTRRPFLTIEVLLSKGSYDDEADCIFKLKKTLTISHSKVLNASLHLQTQGFKDKKALNLVKFYSSATKANL